MNIISSWIRSNFPGLAKFVSDFFKGMSNTNGGHSLRKWLAVGLFWVVAYETFENTTPNNLVEVLMIEVPGILTLAGIYSYFNHKEKKLELNQSKDANTNQPEESQEA